MALATTIELENPALLDPPIDLESVSEFRELPRKYTCLPDENRGDCVDDPCVGCQEPPFFLIAEPGDNVALQFQAADLINPNPAIPTYGWRGASGPYFVGLEVVGEGGAILWEGDTSLITPLGVENAANIGITAAGPVQNITVSIDRLIALLPADTRCWYFRLRVWSGMPVANVADSEELPESPIPVGFVWIDFDTGLVKEWNGFEWEEIGPTGHGEVWYVLDTGIWYEWNDPEWVGLEEPPRPENELTSDTCRTYPYRLRHCNEKIIHFQAYDMEGVDCLGFIHFPLGHTYAMDPIDGLTFVDWYFGPDDPATHADLPIGTTAIFDVIPTPLILTNDGWQWTTPTPEIDAQFLIMNTNAYANAADVFKRTDWVPFVGYWGLDGVLTDHFPGADFDGETVGASPGFQHGFKVCGSVELESLPIELTTTRNGRRMSSTLASGALMRTVGIPEYIARKIQVVMASDGYTLNGETWDTVDNLRKNNERGALWWLSSALTRVDCEQKVPC